MNKKAVRQHYSSVRNNISDAEKQKYDADILLLLINSKLLDKYDNILSYVSYRSEVDTINILKHLFNIGKNVYTPKVLNKTEMVFIKTNDLTDLTEGYMGIPEPTDGEAFEVNNGICLVPGLTFDESGNRMGYGGGYYDRFLSDKDLIKIGLTYECLLSDKVLTEETDVKMDYIITEKRVINCVD